MAVSAASTRGGARKRVHSEFDDGYVIGVFDGCGYTPLAFSWEDEYGCEDQSILATDKLYHKELMRKDGGLSLEKLDELYTFSWQELYKVPTGFSTAPNGDVLTNYGYELNSESNVALEGLRTRHRAYSRRDKYFWTPNDVTQNESGPAELFPLGQIAHSTCPFDEGCNGKCNHDTFCEKESNCYTVDGGEL